MSTSDTIPIGNEKTIKIAEDSLGTKLLKALLVEIQQLQKPWQNTPAAKQADVIDRLRNQITDLVREAILILASDGHPRVMAQVEQVTFKEGVKAVFKLPRGKKESHELADAEGSHVLIVIMADEQHTAGMHLIKPEPDQKDLLEVTVTATDLQDMSAEERLYVLAVQFARAMGFTSIASLKQKFDLADDKASAMIDRMQANNLLGEANADGSYPVNKQPPEATGKAA